MIQAEWSESESEHMLLAYSDVELACGLAIDQRCEFIVFGYDSVQQLAHVLRHRVGEGRHGLFHNIDPITKRRSCLEALNKVIINTID